MIVNIETEDLGVNQEYYLGLDMGTNSVGWAVTNPDYVLLKAKGKDMWGIREFSEAVSAADRRTHRVSRRNHQRSQVRIGLLKSYFHDEIVKDDPNFFVRMDNSFYHADDKDVCLDTLDAIFADPDYRDADYFNEYPTIFHLKYALIKDEVENDSRYARKVYLALLNYYKRRGHFLNASLSGEANESKDVWRAFVDLCETLENELEICFIQNEEIAGDFKAVFTKAQLSRNKKREALMSILDIQKKDKQYLILGAICGLKVDALKLFDLESEQKVTIEFSDARFEEKRDDLYATLGDEYADIVDAMKQVYDAGVLASIMEGVEWLSESRVRDYEKHKADLVMLKKCVRKYCGDEEYNYLFRQDEDSSYSAYIGTLNSGEKIRRGDSLHKSPSNSRYENLKTRIKKDLGQYSEDVDVAYVLEGFDTETFLPKQLTFSNGVIPNQLHEREIRRILGNASKYLSFLEEVDESGLTTSERIIRLFTFQIPYYVGPISQNYKGNGWAIRKSGMENEKVFPWNIEEVIDYAATNEAFITRMVRECTYVTGKQALPKESLEYQRFIVLNTINNLKIQDERISVGLKQDIFRDVFENGSKVTKNRIAKYLKNRGLINEESELSGIDVTIGGQLSTYSRFKPIFGEDINKDSVKEIIENIVFWGTIYGDSKSMIRDQILNNYGELLDDKRIKRILGFKCRDWGNLSREFLELNGCNKETGEITTLIRALWDDNLNLMELLYSDKYTFGEKLEEMRSKELKTLSEFTYEDLAGTYFSAPVKRMIWQTLLIIKEIEKIKGYTPAKIFVEMTRTDEEKGDDGRKNSREKDLLNLYKSIKDDRDWHAEIKAAGESGKLRSKKMFLYYTQMGRDMYTGAPIDLADLFDDNKYDLDHIYPRHYVKDDSIHNNLVLVDKRKNNKKQDVYPISAETRNNPNVIGLWKTLHDKHLINDEKYRRLTGSRPFSEEQRADFIARQMVETGQATKGVNDLLKELIPNTTIVYSKARNVSDFRKDFGFYKSRLLNDFHHAHDAYLNIVVGNVYHTKFTSNPMNFIRGEKTKYNLGKMFEQDVGRNGYKAWYAPLKSQDGQIIEKRKSLETIERVLGKNTPLMTRWSGTQHGTLYDLTIYGADRAKNDSYIPIKQSDEKLLDVEKYGGFNSAKNAYYFLVEHEIPGKGKDKGKMVKIRTLECAPLMKVNQINKSEEELYNYCLELGLKNPSIRMKKIKPQSLIKVNGFPLYLTGRTEDRFVVRNASNLVLSNQWIRYIHKIEKYNKTGVMSECITSEDNKQLYKELLQKHEGFYSKRPTPINMLLKAGEKSFCGLSLERQIYVINQILNVTLICNSAAADLTEIGGSSKSGMSKISKQISKYERVSLITQSVTGLYEKEVDLLSI